ncbi:MAG TPA: JAB domain-containing protein [Bacteroidia bacterium]|nr:JAB domain-containing protein [Bacteroidia bacterium]
MKNKTTNGILFEIEVKYSSGTPMSERPTISSSKDAYEQFKKIWSPTLELREEFYMLLLNRANRLIGWYCISKGGITGTVVDVRLVFSIALKSLACGIIFAHNHPSGNINPSEADIRLTKKLTDSGMLLEILVLDHLIICNDKYFSFTDESLI